MAIVIDNIYTKGISGRVGDALLYKHYGNKTVVSAFPRLTNIAPSARQLAQRKKFALAVLKTRQWLQQKAQRQFLAGLKLKWNSLSAYHAGIKYFMMQPSAPSSPASTTNQTNGHTPVQAEPTTVKNTADTAKTNQPSPGKKRLSNPPEE